MLKAICFCLSLRARLTPIRKNDDDGDRQEGKEGKEAQEPRGALLLLLYSPRARAERVLVVVSVDCVASRAQNDPRTGGNGVVVSCAA